VEASPDAGGPLAAEVLWRMTTLVEAEVRTLLDWTFGPMPDSEVAQALRRSGLLGYHGFDGAAAYLAIVFHYGELATCDHESAYVVANAMSAAYRAEQSAWCFGPLLNVTVPPSCGQCGG